LKAKMLLRELTQPTASTVDEAKKRKRKARRTLGMPAAYGPGPYGGYGYYAGYSGDSGGRKGQLAHWLANMKAGKKKSLNETVIHPSTMDALEDFLPFAMKMLKLNKLPRISVHKTIESGDQPSFGGYNPDDGTIQLALKDRHPADILRTLAHELVHFKQDLNGTLNDDSGMTGSAEENQANSQAGIIMRHFNKRFPQYLE